MRSSLAAFFALAAIACNDNDVVDRSGASTGGPAPTHQAPEADASVPPGPADAAPPTADAAPAPIEDKNLGPSAGCGKKAPPTGVTALTKTVAGKTRTFLRFVPAAYDPKTPIAVVYALHGSGGTAERARAAYDLEAEAKGKAIFVYPQGLPYDANFPGDNRWNPTENSDDYAFLDGLEADLEAIACVDRDRVFAVGFSNGARMTGMLGCYRGDKLRAIATVAAGGNENTLPIKPGSCRGEVAVWGGLGTEDPDHEAGSKIVRDYYTAANGCTAATVATAPQGCKAHQGCRADAPVTWCSYPGGHAWPPIASKGVWGFFDSFQ